MLLKQPTPRNSTQEPRKNFTALLKVVLNLPPYLSKYWTPLNNKKKERNRKKRHTRNKMK